MRYDLERYLSTVCVVEDLISDDENYHEELYKSLGVEEKRLPANESVPFEHYKGRVLRLPKQAMSTIEQIVICKFMLYSYIYHHRKVRAAEGLLSKMLRRSVVSWRVEGMDDAAVVCKFIDLVDPQSHLPEFLSSKDKHIASYTRRIDNRLLPREVLSFVPNMFSGPADEALKDFTSRLLDPKRRPQIVSEFEEIFGNELIKRNPNLGSNWMDALRTAGAWLDVPSPPKFDNVELMVGSETEQAVSLTSIFPIRYWIQAYEAHRYHVRVFSFSEFAKEAQEAAKAAMKAMLKVEDEGFYEALIKKIL